MASGEEWDNIAFLLAKLSDRADIDFGEDTLCEGMVSMLFSFGPAFAPSSIQMTTNAKGRTKMYNISMLINSLLMAGMLKDSSTLKFVLLRALDIALPGHVVQILKETFMKNLCLPSAGTLSRFRVVLDAGFMLWARAWNQSLHNGPSQVVRLFLSDSSPQGNENWQLSEYFLVPNPLTTSSLVDQLTELMQMFVHPATVLQEMHGMDHAEVMEKHHVLSKQLDGVVVHHMLPPTALGFRKQKFTDKLNAILHSIYNESASYKDMRDFLNTICSLTTDLGVESKVGEADNVDLCQLLSQFTHLSYKDDENGMMLDVDDPGNQDFLLPNCLSVAGLCHILHNATSDLTSNLAHFNWFYDSFKALVSLLNKLEFRKHYVNVCLDRPEVGK